MKTLITFIRSVLLILFLSIVFFTSIIYFPNFLEIGAKKIANNLGYQLDIEIIDSKLQDPINHLIHIDFLEISTLKDDRFKLKAEDVKVTINLVSSIINLRPQIIKVFSSQGYVKLPLSKYLDFNFFVEDPSWINPVLEIKNFKIVSSEDSAVDLNIKNLKLDNFKEGRELILDIYFLDDEIFSLKASQEGMNTEKSIIEAEVMARELDFKEIELLNLICGACVNFGILDGDMSLVFLNNKLQEIKGTMRSDFFDGSLYMAHGIDKGINLTFNYLNLISRNDNEGNFLKLVKEHIFFPISLNIKELFINNKFQGEWSFDLGTNHDLVFKNIHGSYGAWDISGEYKKIFSSNLKKNKRLNYFSGDISTMNISKGLDDLGYVPSIKSDLINLKMQIKWNGSFFSFKPSNIEGTVDLNAKKLLFIDIDEELKTESNYLRLVSIFNLTDTFEKITNLDFTKLLSSGYGVDKVTGKLDITSSDIKLLEPIYFKSGASEIKWQGSISKNSKSNLSDLDLTVFTTLPITEFMPAYGLVLGGPAAAGALYIAGKLFEKELDKIGTGKWIISGSLLEPKVEFMGWNQ